jgi:pyrimidine-specific ribonucleoside hydrolase
LGLLERLGAPQIPVACGRIAPLLGDHAFPEDWRAAADAASGLALPETARVPYNGTANALISREAEENPGLAVLTLGPLTNLADGLQADPALVGRLGTVTVMGGALHVPGNILGPGAPTGNTVAEWNIYVDPHAASMLVGSGLQPRLVSLDGTSQVPVTTAFAGRVAAEADAPAARVLADLFATHPFMTNGTYYLWDPLAAELAASYPVGTFSPAAVTVEEADGPESGFTRSTDEAPNVSYLSAANRASAEDTLLSVLNGN